MLWLLSFTIGFFIVLKAWDLFFRAIGYKFYLDKDDYDRLDLRQLYTSNTHHVIVLVLVFYSLLNSECSDAYNYIWFKDEVCFYSVDKQHVINVMFAVAYLIYDFILLMFFFKLESALIKQTLYHHVFGAICLLCALNTGYAMIGIANASLICEISTIFLNYRNQYKTEELNERVPMVNQIIFLITFIITRIFLLPYLFWLELLMIARLWNDLSDTRRITAITCATMCVLMILINLYWFKLIMKGLRRMLEKNGIIKDSRATNKYERVEVQEK